MAVRIYYIGSTDYQPVGGTAFLAIYDCDTTAEKPASGLNVCDFCWDRQTNKFFIANSATTWSEITRGEVSPVFHPRITLGSSAPPTSDYVDLTSSAEGAGGANFTNGYGDVGLVGAGADPPASGRMGKVNRLNQSAAIAATNLTNACPAGLYRISYHMRCTVGDAAAGSVQFTVNYYPPLGFAFSSAAVLLTGQYNSAQGVMVVPYDGTNEMNYFVALTGSIGTSRYDLRARCEYLG